MWLWLQGSDSCHSTVNQPWSTPPASCASAEHQLHSHHRRCVSSSLLPPQPSLFAWGWAGFLFCLLLFHSWEQIFSLICFNLIMETTKPEGAKAFCWRKSVGILRSAQGPEPARLMSGSAIGTRREPAGGERGEVQLAHLAPGLLVLSCIWMGRGWADGEIWVG